MAQLVKGTMELGEFILVVPSGVVEVVVEQGLLEAMAMMCAPQVARENVMEEMDCCRTSLAP